ncbi:MAG TPA: hypothetical protein VK428_16190 [Acidimicrobiales bacterium]|nr:hypothetical protein [Acidimicrobiales bacterium]
MTWDASPTSSVAGLYLPGATLNVQNLSTISEVVVQSLTVGPGGTASIG